MYISTLKHSKKFNMVLPDFGLFHPYIMSKRKNPKRLRKHGLKRRMDLAKIKGLHQFVHGSQLSSKAWPKSFT